MKALKYTAVILLVLAIVAGVAHFYRESLVREIANSALGDLGITATELSIQTLGTDDVRLSHLALEQDDGMRYEISGLTFPIGFPSTRAERISIETLAMTAAETAAEPGPLASLLRMLLQLPGSVPNTEVTVDRLTMADYPTVYDIVWRTEEQRQQLAFRVDTVEVTAAVDRAGDDAHSATVNAVAAGNPDALSLVLSVTGGASGFTMDGTVTISSAPWVPVLKSIGMLPAELVSLDAELAGPISIVLDDDALPFARAAARLSLADELTSQYGTLDDPGVRLRAALSEPLSAGLEYPSLEWTARVGQADVRIGTESNGDIPMRLSDLECRAGIRCAVRASLDTGPVELAEITIANAIMVAPLTITAEATTRVDVSPDFALTLTGVETPAFAAASIAATRLSGARLTIEDSGWKLDADRLQLAVDAFTDREGLRVSGPAEFETLRVRDAGATLDTDISIPPNAAKLVWDGTGIVVPGVTGKISVKEDRVSAAVVLADEKDALSASIDASHDMANGAGTIAVRDAKLNFAQGKLSGRLLEWPYAWDVVAGTWTAGLDLHWQDGDDGLEYDGTMTHRADSLAGRYKDTAFAGLSTTLSANLDSTKGIAVAPASIDVALVDVGLPLEQITADYSLDVDAQAVQVQNLTVNALGGRVAADPFRFSLQAEKNDIILRPQSIQLQFIMDLAEFDDIELGGSISGEIPVTISDMNVTITNGRLRSDPPGGVIRYRAGIGTGNAGAAESGVGLVSQALANFQFDSLTSDVDYLENGDLILQMRLSGINPDMDERQPVILNLGVTNNIPKLLRSLRATRSIEEILERKSAN